MINSDVIKLIKRRVRQKFECEFQLPNLFECEYERECPLTLQPYIKLKPGVSKSCAVPNAVVTRAMKLF